jgi:hypothetical protein
MTGTPDPIQGLEAWYGTQCDGEWEHSYGITIDTLDNPGWSVRIDLADTSLAERAFDRAEIHRSEHDWLVCWRQGLQFNAACGPSNLREALSLFLQWAG